jgi:hypothetical protein
MSGTPDFGSDWNVQVAGGMATTGNPIVVGAGTSVSNVSDISLTPTNGTLVFESLVTIEDATPAEGDGFDLELIGQASSPDEVQIHAEYVPGINNYEFDYASLEYADLKLDSGVIAAGTIPGTALTNRTIEFEIIVSSDSVKYYGNGKLLATSAVVLTAALRPLIRVSAFANPGSVVLKVNDTIFKQLPK